MLAKRSIGIRRIIIASVALLIVGSVILLGISRNGSSSANSLHKADGSPAAQSPDKTPPADSSFDATKYSLTDPNSMWVVVNKHRPLNPKNYAPSDLVSVGNGQAMRAEAASALSSLIAGAKTAGLTVTAASAYRSYDTQVSVYNREVVNYGTTVADSESARPGYSEHQTGLSVDIAGGGCSITDCFANTAQGQWVAAHAYEYGYILRYPADKTAITGYRAEAWHFRYVGKDLATEMHKTGIKTLEEFFGLDTAPDYN